MYLTVQVKDRYVPLPDHTLMLLRHLWVTHRNPNWIFPSRNGLNAFDESAVQKAFQGALRESGVNKIASVHTLRHYVECWIMVSV
jgi:integrase/recombinase XerD